VRRREGLTLETDSAPATERFAGELAASLRRGDIVLVSGEVGTGKTTFVRGACRALGVSDRVTSPSFTIGHLYRGEVPVAHIDLFRLESLAGEDPGLLEQYLVPDQIAFIEWPGAATPELDPDRIAVSVRLEHLGGDRRLITME
jgi:tRNA threonylcarbamoyladenosine biosynthesis protein TsaE